MSVGFFFLKLPSYTKLISQHSTFYSLLIVFIYNQLYVNTYQQHISTIYHQQVITTRNTKKTRCMYNFLFITDYNPWGFLATTEQSTTLQEHQLYHASMRSSRSPLSHNRSSIMLKRSTPKCSHKKLSINTPKDILTRSSPLIHKNDYLQESIAILFILSSSRSINPFLGHLT